MTNDDRPSLAERTIRCPVCGPVDTYDDAAWATHCAHLPPSSGGFDADDFDAD